MAESITILLVSQDQHLNSAAMSDQIVREVLQQVKKNHPKYSIKHIQLAPDQKCTLPAVKIHQFPSLILNGKQITAGSIISEERLDQLIKNI